MGEVSALQENLAAKEPKVEETRELKAAWMETLGDFFGVGELARGPKSPTALLRRALLTTTYILRSVILTRALRAATAAPSCLCCSTQPSARRG